MKMELHNSQQEWIEEEITLNENSEWPEMPTEAEINYIHTPLASISSNK